MNYGMAQTAMWEGQMIPVRLIKRVFIGFDGQYVNSGFQPYLMHIFAEY